MKKHKRTKIKKEKVYRLVFISVNPMSVRTTVVDKHEFSRLQKHKADLQSGMMDSGLYSEVLGMDGHKGQSKAIANSLLIFDYPKEAVGRR